MTAPDPSVAIYTIGHGDRSFHDLEQRLARHHVQMIVDVRTSPYSRHAPEFTKAELEEIAAEAGLGYRWMGDHLGGRPDDPPRHDDGTIDELLIQEDPKFRSGIAELLGLARSSRVALLCAELDHRHCHRSRWIAPALEGADARVWHIDAAGDAETHQRELGL
jgi:uncharacterized protein (DUF488 family)